MEIIPLQLKIKNFFAELYTHKNKMFVLNNDKELF